MEFKIPGRDDFEITHVVCDYNGTIALDGSLKEGVKQRFKDLNNLGLKVSVITADTHGNARSNLEGVACEIQILSTDQHDKEKADYVLSLGAGHVIAFGNGQNDRLMLQQAQVGVALLQEEGLCVRTLDASDVLVRGINDGLDLLLSPKRLVATLRV